ncbi:small ribosomal subunit protein mS23-like [Amphiura filiformis]|uniref:small ribosomal subunit protein mS23-like n=1 Tax=Amphiura filiformis TaxID=82378 RepID=UPI003B228968
MAGLSRVPTHGTVFTRVRNLIRAGVVKDRDRPLWYDVMVAYPPKEEGELPGIDHGQLVREILYPEDNVRAKFYKTFGSVRALNMSRQAAVSTTPCARFIAKYQELEKSWEKSEEELFEATQEELEKEGMLLRKKGEKRKPVKPLVTKELSSQEVAAQTLAILFQKSTEAKQSDPVSTRTEDIKDAPTAAEIENKTDVPVGDNDDKR